MLQAPKLNLFKLETGPPSNNKFALKLKSALKKSENGVLNLNLNSPKAETPSTAKNKKDGTPKSSSFKSPRINKKIYTREEIEDFQLVRREFLERVNFYLSSYNFKLKQPLSSQKKNSLAQLRKLYIESVIF
jgi:hypothetical protein